MKQPLITKSVLGLTLMLAVVAAAVGTFAYSEPTAAYPANTTEPIDTSLVDQAKAGGLSVYAFFARGNADFKKDLSIDGVAQGGNPGDTASEVNIQSNVLATGDLKALDHLSAQSLRHNENSPKPVCGDAGGIVVFCPDQCSNIDGAQGTIPPNMIRNPDGTCTAPPDLCSNVDGLQATLNPDLTIDNPSTPTICTQTIRGTIWAGTHGSVVRNMANNAMLAQLYLKQIKITSIGGNTSLTAWPTGIEPLKFRWGICSKWNPQYQGPSVFNSMLNGTPNDAYPNAASVSQGVCFGYKNDFTQRSALTYGSWIYDQENGKYLAWDGVSGMTPFWFDDGGTPRFIEDPKGFFDAARYDATGTKTARADHYKALNFFIRKGYTSDDYANIKLPVEKLILSDVVVPNGYRLILTTDPIKSPGTVVELYPRP